MYDIFYIGNHNLKGRFPTAKRVDTFDQAQAQSLTKMFWLVWEDIEIVSDFDFSYKADDYSYDVTHIFKNANNYDGVCLFPKNSQPHSRELEYRFFASKKEVDIVASVPKEYDILYVKDYEDYIIQLQKSSKEVLYVVPNDIICNYDFSYTIPHNQKDLIHVFKNGKYNDGVLVHHRNKQISKREFEFSWYANKKELDIVASQPKPYDIVFISYNEPNADENYAALCERFPRAKRIHGVKGIHQAHIEAAKICDTDMFWIVDGDAIIVDEFNFDYQVPKWQRDHVFVWRSQNPINDMVYGYGGIKLFPKKETINMDTSKPDMTTSISSKFNAVKDIANITAFNTDPFNTWKSAFRECAKLSSKVIDRQKSDETDERLKIWTTVGNDRLYGKYALAGANAGMEFGKSNNTDLTQINDFDWLKEKFDAQNI